MRTRFRRFAALAVLAAAAALPLAAVAADVVQTVQEDAQLSVLARALKQTGLDSTLREGTYTLIAPTDDAFALYFGKARLQALLSDPAASTQLRTLLQGMIVPGRQTPPYGGSATLKSLAGRRLHLLGNTDGSISVDDARVANSGQTADNGIVYVVDAVIPPATRPSR